jgi:endoglucanase
MAKINDMLLKLVNESGPSGFEQTIRSLLTKELRKYVKDIKTDKFGNLIAHKKGKKPTILLVAHMDEIGLLIKGVSEEGHISLATVGGIEPLALIGERVKIETKKGFLQGIITTKEMHNGEEITILPPMKELYVDTGLTKSQLIKSGVTIGDYLHLVNDATNLGNEKIITGKALDDRLGCFVLLEVMKRLRKNPYDFYYIFTVQEEMGLYGAKTSVYNLNPDWAIVVDTTNAEDFDARGTKEIGKGPCITIKDAEMMGNKCLNDIFKDIAKKKKIPLQIEITDFGTTDALSISVAKGGIPTGMVSIPVRNIHTMAGIAHLDDIENAIKIIQSILANPPKTCVS